MTQQQAVATTITTAREREQAAAPEQMLATSTGKIWSQEQTKSQKQ
jgi:hypothetical protein